MEPGHKSAGAIPKNGFLPISHTAANVNLEEIHRLHSTMAKITRSCSSAARVRDSAPARDFANIPRRSPATARDGRKIVHLLQKRTKYIRDGIHNFALVAKLGARQKHIACWVDSANAMFRSSPMSSRACGRSSTRRAPLSRKVPVL